MSDQQKGQMAFGHPGGPPSWTSSAKQGVGTAYATASSIWYTISLGILNEIYYPTIDRPQTREMLFLMTDGRTFFHGERDDFDHQVSVLENTQGYRIINQSKDGRYRFVKEMIANPTQSCLLMHVRVEGEDELLKNLQLYSLLYPHLEVSGMGNTGWRMNVAGWDILAASRGGTFLAIGVSTGFTQTSCGFVGASDGWTDIHEHLRMTYTFDRAEDGNIALTGRIDISRSREFTLGIAFGDTLHSAVADLLQSLTYPYDLHRQTFFKQWREAQSDRYELAKVSGDGGAIFGISHRILLTHEDKMYPGAFIASASIPWGEAKGDNDIGGYHMVWVRDLVQAASALLALGDTDTPQRALVYLACTQSPDGNFPQNFWVNGVAHWRGIQLDQTAFPILLAWRMWKEGALHSFDPYPMVRKAAGFLVEQGPYTLQDRWEHSSGYCTSTLAVMITALVCASEFARDHGEDDLAAFLLDSADFLESHVEQWTTTKKGSLVNGIPRHYIYVLPIIPNGHSPEEDPETAVLDLPNQKPGDPTRYPAREIVSDDFLELVRFGIRHPHDTLVEDSLRVVDAVLKVDTPFGPSWHRYNHDGYGEHPDGDAYDGWGVGRAWPLLTGERGHYELAAGRDPQPLLKAMESFATQGGLLPEQVWDTHDIPEKLLYFGRPTGSAKPLVWAHAEYIKLLRSVRDGRIFDQVPSVADRYLNGRGRRDLEVWKFMRQVRTVRRNHVLRVQAGAKFRLRWTHDEWKSFQDTPCRETGVIVRYVDIPISHDQQAPIRFTFFWTDSERWAGRDFLVRVE